jgi:TRAP-type C4-dicarboxylate transport system permease small subunit
MVRLEAAARFAAELVAAVMFAAVFLIFCAKIAARYLAHDAMAWADEVTVILFIWMIFWSNAFILAEREHIRFDLLTHAARPAARRAMAIARALLIGGLFAYAAPATMDYILFLWRERTPVLGLRLDQVYFCFGIFIISVPLRAGWALWGLAGAHWRSHA